MKKFIIAVVAVVLAVLALDAAYYRLGFYIDFNPGETVTTYTKTEGKEIYIDKGNGFEPFEIRGVNLGSGEPGEWSTDFDIDEETYIRWFGQMQEMGANTLRIYTIQADDFYNAYYKYNTERENQGKEPLWLLHGVWVNDYVQFSHLDAYSSEFMDTLISDSKTLVDVVHGKKKISLGRVASAGSGTYNHDISRWVIGYLLGVEWESETVIYTNQMNEDREKYEGKYVYTTEDATPFEVMLARVGDEVISYESKRYKQQRLLAFSNWPTTDPFKYPAEVSLFWSKFGCVNVEHIRTTEEFLSGQFASYHVYSYYPDYLESLDRARNMTVDEWQEMIDSVTYRNVEQRLKTLDAPEILDYITGEDYIDDQGRYNTYLAYLNALNRYHTLPVVITEFGVSTGRGLAQLDANTGRNQGHMSEQEQGEAIIECYQDIQKSGCAGACVFSWQDEWFKRTWNTMYAIDMRRTPYWSDYQTNEQYFGLLSFDPGEEESVCYVDGDVSEWSKEDVVSENEDIELSAKYDEKFVYFLVKKKNLDFENDKIYIPVDTTQKSGSSYCEEYGVKFDRAADFLIILHGADNSRIQVQERYEALRSTYSEYVRGFNSYEKGNIPDSDSPYFSNIELILKIETRMFVSDSSVSSMTFETGKLKYGNANPESDDFNSLADFCSEGDYIEIKLPWQILNFADPSRMEIHDDYYDGNYGVKYINIDKMYIGAGVSEDERIRMSAMKLEGWGNKVTYHERLKESYYALQKVWRR